MLIKLEVTTRCNFDCWYCAGRHMPQKDMSRETFADILKVIEEHPTATVHLQGEGEPMLAKDIRFFAESIKALGNRLVTTTNLGYKLQDWMLDTFDFMEVSVDAIKPPTAEAIGRHDVVRTLNNIGWILKKQGPRYIRINTVKLDPLDLRDVKKFAAKYELELFVQELNPKADYSIHYPNKVYIPIQGDPVSCKYVEQPLMRYFDVNGLEMPCCFIKDASLFKSTAQLKTDMETGAPAACTGCTNLKAKTVALSDN